MGQTLEKLLTVFQAEDITRRQFLKGAVLLAGTGAAATTCATMGYTPGFIPKEDKANLRHIEIPGAKNIKRKGADLFWSSVLNPVGYGDYRRHYATGTDGGIDLYIGGEKRMQKSILLRMV